MPQLSPGTSDWFAEAQNPRPISESRYLAGEVSGPCYNEPADDRRHN